MFLGCILPLKTLAGSTAPILGLAGKLGSGAKGHAHTPICLSHRGKRVPLETLTLWMVPA